MRSVADDRVTNSSKPPEERPRFRYEDVPAELRELRCWMGTRFEVCGAGKINKPPYRVRRGKRVIMADKREPDNWASFDEARAAYERGDVDAIGVVLTPADPFFLADCDGVLDPETGELDARAHQVVHTLGSYTERSCSGTGLHTIGRGRKPSGAGCKSRALGFGLELYDGVSGARFVVLTGWRAGAVREVHERERELEELCARAWPPEPKAAEARERPHSPTPVPLADGELLKRARRARTGAKFKTLYDRGDTSGYASHSEADFALLNTLIFWTGGERERVERLFESSALYRERGKDRGYVGRSTARALEKYRGAFYRPRDLERARQEDTDAGESDPLEPYLALLLQPHLWTGRKGASAYKAYAGMMLRAVEVGVVGDGGELRVGCDVRTLAEYAGMNLRTLTRSALPHLIQDMKLVRWRRSRGRGAGVFVMPKPEGVLTAHNKVSTHFNVGTWHNPETPTPLEVLRLLVRMRRGHDKRAATLRLGMVAMFATVALAAGGARRVQTIEELASSTGRRKPDLRRVLTHLKAAEIVREPEPGRYRLTDSYAAAYERALQLSGVTRSERRQRVRHEHDRAERARRTPPSKRSAPLRGPEHNRRVAAKRAREDKRSTVERAREKVGATVAPPEELQRRRRIAEIRRRVGPNAALLEERRPWDLEL